MAYDDVGRRYPDGYGTSDDLKPPAHGDYPDDPFSPERDPYAASPSTGSTDLPTVETRYNTGTNSAIGDRLDHVYDEVGDRESNDRLLVHIVLEVVLMLGAGGIMFAAYQADSSLFKGSSLKHLILALTAVLFIATASALTLRVRAVNLGLFAFVFAGAAIFLELYNERGTAVSGAIAIGTTLAAGVVLAILILLFKVPGWAAGLGVGLALFAGVTQLKLPAKVPDYAFDVNSRGLILCVAAVAVSVVGGIVGALPGTRRVLGACRDTNDGQKRSRGAITATLFGTVGAAVLAGVAGVILALSQTGGSGTGAVPGTTVLYGGLGLAAALLGGTSAHGRRGGFVGTLLGTAAMVGFYMLGVAKEWSLSPTVYVGAGLVAGLVVTWLVELLGKPDQVRLYDDKDGERGERPTEKSREEKRESFFSGR